MQIQYRAIKARGEIPFHFSFISPTFFTREFLWNGFPSFCSFFPDVGEIDFPSQGILFP